MRPVANPPNPWDSAHVEYLGEPPPARLELYEEMARSIVSSNDSPDLAFRHSVNPYRGCFHGCAYCYARPSHQYLGFGAGTDFERRIVVKVNAPALLRAAFEARTWRGDGIVFSGVTDCYQPIEASYGLTRQLLEICCEYRNPVGIVTKGALVARDLDVLTRLAGVAGCRVFVSVAWNDEALARAMEPYASTLRRRFEVIRRLTEAGIETGVSVSPVIPGLNDDAIPDVLEQARACGARWAFMGMLRLPAEVAPVFEARLTEAVPLRAGRVLAQIRQVRGGRMNDARFGHRMQGEGPRWRAIEDLFAVHHRRLGFLGSMELSVGNPGNASSFRRPAAQRDLFEP